MVLLFPYSTDRPPRRTPWATYSIIALNVLIFGWWWFGTHRSEAVLRSLSFIPAAASWPTWITTLFIHGGWLHLGFNMLFLWVFGRSLEDAMGTVLYTATYLAAGISATLLHFITTKAFDPAGMTMPCLGASGAISGLMGVFAVRFYQTRIHFWYLLLFRPGTFAIGSLWGIGLWVVNEVAGGILDIVCPGLGGGVAHWAHIGGFVFGMGYAFLVRLQHEARSEYQLDDASHLFLAGDYDRAGDHAQGLLHREPDNVDAHLLAARAHHQLGATAKALAHFSKVLRLHLLTDSPEVLDVYREMIRNYPQAVLDVRTQFAVASRLAQAGDHKAASLAFLKVARHYPRTPEAQTSLLKCGLLCLDSLQQPEKAVEFFEALLNRYPLSEWRSFARQEIERARKATGGVSDEP